MISRSILSTTGAVLLLALNLVSAAPAPRNPPKARIIPFTSKHAAVRQSDTPNSLDVLRQDLARIKRMYFGTTDDQSSKESMDRPTRRATTLEPYDVGPDRRLSRKRQSSTSDSLENHQDFWYSGDISVGTPGQEIPLIFDTGSSSLLIPTSVCASCPGPLFDTKRSSTFRAFDPSFNNSFFDGTREIGNMATDVVALGGLSVLNQTFVAVTNYSTPVGPIIPGTMGLGFPANAQWGAIPWFINLATQGSLASNIFSFYLTHGGDKGSELCIGCLDSTKFTGEPEYFPVIPVNGTQKWWTIQSAGTTYNNVSVTEPFIATIDSGTTNIVLPDSAAAALYSKIPGAHLSSDGQTWNFPCSSNSSIGSIGFKFTSDTVFNIDPTLLNAGAIAKGSDTCAGVIASGAPDGMAIIGDVFLSEWYSVFDYGNMRTGFARSIN